MLARLSVFVAEGPVSMFRLGEGREYVLGRDPADGGGASWRRLTAGHGTDLHSGRAENGAATGGAV